jgi:hypothetical protein
MISHEADVESEVVIKDITGQCAEEIADEGRNENSLGIQGNLASEDAVSIRGLPYEDREIGIKTQVASSA